MELTKIESFSHIQKRYIIELLVVLCYTGLESLVIGDDKNLTKFFEFQLVAVYGYIQWQSIKQFGMFNFFSLVMAGFFMFAIGGILHYLFSEDVITEIEGGGFDDFYFTHVQIQQSLLIYTLFISIAYLTYKHIYRRIPQFDASNCNYLIGDDSKFFKIGKFLMWAFLAVEIYKGYLYFTSFSLDRVLIYLYGNMENPVPSWVRFMATIFEMGYAFILCSIPDAKTFKKYSSLYFVVLIPEILLGNRSMLGAFILFVLWYYAKFYNPRPIKTKYLIVLGTLLLLLFQAMQFYRDDSDMSAISYSMTQFLKGQAISFYLLPLYMQYAGSIQYYLYPFVLYNLISGFSGYTGQSIEVLQHNCGVGHQLSYTINPDFYLSGASLGSSCITELYDLGIIGVIVGAVFFPIMIAFLEKEFAKSRFALFLSYYLLSTFVLAARGSYFPSLYIIVKYFIFYQLLLIAYNFFKRSRKQSQYEETYHD